MKMIGWEKNLRTPRRGLRTPSPDWPSSRRRRSTGTLWRRPGRMKRRPPLNPSLPPRFPWAASEWRRRRPSTELSMAVGRQTQTEQRPRLPHRGYQSSLNLPQTIWKSRWRCCIKYWKWHNKSNVHTFRKRWRRRQMKSPRLKGSWEESLTSWVWPPPPRTASSPPDDTRPTWPRTRAACSRRRGRRTRTTQIISARWDIRGIKVCPETLS